MASKDKGVWNLLEGAKITLFISAFVAFFVVTVMPGTFWDENVIPAFGDLVLTYLWIFARSVLVIGALLFALAAVGHIADWWYERAGKP